jgi:hypothetical protein
MRFFAYVYRRIGINTGSIQWAAGGLTHNLYKQLCEHLPDTYVKRLISAEPLATRWLSTLSDKEFEFFEHVVHVAHKILAYCLGPEAITPAGCKIVNGRQTEFHLV